MRYRDDIFKIAFTGIMLGLVFLFRYLERFMPLNMGYVNIDISVIFIIATAYIAGFRMALLLFILRFLVGPGMGKSGFTDIGYWGNFILLTYDFMFFAIFIVANKFLNNKYYSGIIAILFTVLISGLLNGALFTPVYWKIYGYIKSADINSAKAVYMTPFVKNPMFFGIPNYWGGMFAVYGLANLIKFSIVLATLLPLFETVKLYIRKKKPNQTIRFNLRWKR